MNNNRQIITHGLDSRAYHAFFFDHLGDQVAAGYSAHQFTLYFRFDFKLIPYALTRRSVTHPQLSLFWAHDHGAVAANAFNIMSANRAFFVLMVA